MNIVLPMRSLCLSAVLLAITICAGHTDPSAAAPKQRLEREQFFPQIYDAHSTVPASADELTPERRQQIEDEIGRQMDSSSVRFLNDEFYWIGFRGRNPDYKEFQILRASRSQTRTFQVTCEKDGFTVTAYDKSLEPRGDLRAKAEPETAGIIISGRAYVFALEFVTRETNSILIVGRTSPDEMPGKAVVEAVIAGVESFTVLEKTSGEPMEFLSGGLETTAAKQFRDACYRG